MSVGFLSHETAANLVRSKEARLVHSELMLWMKEGGKRGLRMLNRGCQRQWELELRGAKPGRGFDAFEKWLIRNCNYR